MARRMRILDLQSISIQPSIRSTAIEMTELGVGDELIVAVRWFPATGYRWVLAAAPAGVVAEPIEHMLPAGSDPEQFDEVLSHFRFRLTAAAAGLIRLRCARPELDYDPKGLEIEIRFISDEIAAPTLTSPAVASVVSSEA